MKKSRVFFSIPLNIVEPTEIELFNLGQIFRLEPLTAQSERHLDSLGKLATLVKIEASF